MSDFYYDTFDGAVGTFAGRTPNVGSAYYKADASYDLADLNIDGSGNWTITRNVPRGTVAVSDPSTVPSTYTFDLVFHVDPAEASHQTSVQVWLRSGSVGFATHDVSIQVWANYSSVWQVIVSVYQNSPSIYADYAHNFTPTNASQTVRVEVSGSGTVVSLDNTQIWTDSSLLTATPEFVLLTVSQSDTATVGAVESLRLYAVDPPNTGTASLTFASSSIDGRGGGAGNLAGPQATTFAYGYSPSAVYGLTVAHGGNYAVEGRGGATVGAQFPAITASITGTIVLLGRLTAQMPVAALAASGTTTILGRATLAHRGLYALLGGSGGSAQFAGPLLRLQISGAVSTLGQARLRFPAATLTATGQRPNVGQANLLMPAALMVPVGRLVGAVPRLALTTSARLLITPDYEGYNILLLETDTGMATATTRCTDFPFERIVRWDGKYFGVGADGLYELGGDTFDGDPIVAQVATAETDFDSPTLKRARALFLSGRVGADFDVTVETAEANADGAYTYRPVTKDTAGAFRVTLGRGIRSTYFAYRFTNVAGEDFTLDGMTPEVDVQRRTI